MGVSSHSWVLGLAVLMSAALSPMAVAAPSPRSVAFVEPSYPDGDLGTLIQVKRSGMPLPVSGKSVDLRPGDQIFVLKRETVVTVHYVASNAVVPVHHGDGLSANQADLTVGTSALPGLTEAAMAWFKDQLRPIDHDSRRTELASRVINVSQTCYNASGRTDDPTPFKVPSLSANRSQIVAGERALYVSWVGGANPFSVTLTKAETGQVIAHASASGEDCAVRLPRTHLQPGRYDLTVADANNVKEEEDSLFVTPDAPGMPDPLKIEDVPAEARDLYFATWLSVIDGGRWAFEAEQRVAAMDCRSVAVQDWLSQRGAKLICPSHRDR